jgi:hypothetical protein
MNNAWLGMIALGMTGMAAGCVVDPGDSADPPGGGAGVPAEQTPGPASIDPVGGPWLVGLPHAFSVSWRQAPSTCQEFWETCGSISFIILSKQCTGCSFPADQPDAGRGSFIAIPDGVGALHLQVMVKAVVTQQTRTLDFDVTADAHRALDVRCYVLHGDATPCGATRTAADQIVLQVQAAMESGRTIDIGDKERERVTIDGLATWTVSSAVERGAPYLLSSLVRPRSPLLGTSAVVAWTDPAGKKLAASVVIPTLAP